MSLQTWGLIASVICTIIAALSAWATHRSAAQASVKVAEVTSRGNIEEAAFARAEAFYTKVIERQDKETEELNAHVERLEKELASVKEKTEMCQSECAELRRKYGYWLRTAQQLARAFQRLRQHVDPDHTDHSLVELDETVLRVLNEDL